MGPRLVTEVQRLRHQGAALKVHPVLAVRAAAALILPLLAVTVCLAACGPAGSITSTSSMSASTAVTAGEIDQLSKTPQTLPAVDGWTITLIPGTDKMRTEYEEPPAPGSTTGTWSPPAPPTFQPSVAIDGDRVVYSAFYAGRPQVYLYDIAGGAVTQLSDDPPDPQKAYGEQIQVQISGDWVAWQRGYNTEDIVLHNLATRETRRFRPQQTVTSWRLTGGRLAWTEGTQLHGARLYLYDPTIGSTQTIAAAYGLTGFGMDDHHIAWVGGASWNEMWLYDLTTGQTRKVTDASQHAGEEIMLKGDLLAWAEYYSGGQLTRVVICNIRTGDTRVLDEFGPFDPQLRADGRYLAWMRGEEATGLEARVYDTQTGAQTKLGDVATEQDSWPSVDAGRVAWNRASSPSSGQSIMVRDLPDGPTIQLTDGSFTDQPPAVGGNHIVWWRDNNNFFAGSTAGRGIFVASHAD